VTTHSPVIEWLNAHSGIDEGIAELVGFSSNGDTIRFRYDDAEGEYFRTRKLPDGQAMQPKGRKLSPWTPLGTDGVLLVVEGESDLLSIASALYAAVNVADDDDEPELELVRRTDLPPPLANVVPVAVPGVGNCHNQIANLAEELVADILIAFDGDDAGRANAKKLAKKANGTIVRLSDGLDVSDVLHELPALADRTEVLANLVAEAEAAVEEAPAGDDVDDQEAAEIEPLPNDAVNTLLDQVAAQLARYVVLPGEHESVALSLFVAHTWAIGGAHATPYMLIVSPEKRSGKSRLLQVIEQVVARPWGVIGASEAAMFRKIAKNTPTLLLDEIDAIFGSHAERTEPLRAILNAGNRPGATVARCVGENKDVEDFPIFCAKVLAGIDSGYRIPDTVRDRAVTIHMQRKTGAEPVERFRYRDADGEAHPIREALERWAVGAVDLLLAADPHLPQELDDRAAEAWEPLLAIADMAGSSWPKRAREAAIALSGQEDREEVTTGTLLLGALRSAFGDVDRMATTALLDVINADDELPFGGWRDGKGLDGRRLAKLLKPYGIRPRTIRFGEHTEKGYLAESLADAWERWLPTRTQPSQASHPSHDVGAVTTIPLEQADVTDVTDVTATAGSNGTVTATEDEEAEIERIAAKIGSVA
jgi:Protein of unknown function (DUF3631)/Toprim-like